MKNTLILLSCIFLVACAQRMDDDAGDDDVVNPDHDPDDDQDPDPDPACVTAADCAPIDGCSLAACVAGACSSEPACGADQACDEDRNECVDVVPPPPGSGTIVCAEVSGAVEVTVSGGILDHLSVDPATGPTTSWKLVYGSSPGDWEVPYASGSSKDWKAWTTDGASYKLRLPNSVTSFNIALTNGTDANSEYWLDLNEYVVSGSTCAHVMDGGSVTRTATTVPNGTISCAESGNYVNVTIGAGILNHLLKSDGTDADGTVTPTTSWKLMYGSSPGSWAIPYASGSTKDWEYWQADTVSYLLQVTNDVTLFNFVLTDGTNTYWFDLDEFNVSGSTCAHVAGGGGITRTATSTPAPTLSGTIECRLTTVDGILKREVHIIPNSNGIISGTVQQGSPVTSPEFIRLDVNGMQQPWVTDTSGYFFYPATTVDDFNFIVVDNNDVAGGEDSAPGGDYFDLDKWSITNVGSAGCHRVGGGISIN